MLIYIFKAESTLCYLSCFSFTCFIGIKIGNKSSLSEHCNFFFQLRVFRSNHMLYSFFQKMLIYMFYVELIS